MSTSSIAINQDAQQSPYDRGRLLALSWDRAVRVASSGRLSLDEVMRRQRDAVRAGAKGYGAALFPGILRAVAPGIDVDADLARYVTKGETVRLAPGVFGACLTLEDLRVAVFDRGFDGSKSSQSGIISGVDPAGPAHAAGLRGFRASATTCGAPPSTGMVFSFVSCQNASRCPSGDHDGYDPFSVPGTARATGESRERT